MFTTLKQCMAGGGAYSSHIRVDLSSGDVIVKKAQTVSKYRTKGKLTIAKNISVPKSELTGDITKISFTDSVGGNALIGGEAEVSESGNGELSTIITLTLTLPEPNGFEGSEKMFEVLTGSAPLEKIFTAVSDSGENATVTYDFSAANISVSATVQNSFHRMMMYYGGELAFTCRYTSVNTSSYTATPLIVGELHCKADDVTAVDIKLASNKTSVTNDAYIRCPTSFFNDEHELSVKVDGNLKSRGDYVALLSEKNVCVCGKDFVPITERKANGLRSFDMTESGYCVMADADGLRIFRGSKDIYTQSSNNIVSVALSDNRRGLFLYYSNGNYVECRVIMLETGSSAQVYRLEFASYAITTRNEDLITIGDGLLAFRLSNGYLSQSSIQGYRFQELVGSGQGHIIFKTSSGSYREVLYRKVVTPLGAPIAVSDRLYLTEINGQKMLVLAGESGDSNIIMELDAEDIAYAHGRLYYCRGNKLYYREAATYKTIVMSNDITSSAQLSVSETYTADKANMLSAKLNFDIQG